MNYRLTISNIKGNIKEYSDLGKPLFRFVKNKKQTEVPWLFAKDSNNKIDTKRTDVCPVVDQKSFQKEIESCFSRTEDEKCTNMNDPSLLFFFMGGNYRLVTENTFMNKLVNAKPNTKVFYDPIVEDLINWKFVPKDDKEFFFVNKKLESVPKDAISPIDYIVHMNEYIIRNFCSLESQDNLRKLLSKYAEEIERLESKEPEWLNEDELKFKELICINSQMVKLLKTLLNDLVALAKGTKYSGLQPLYLAEGLTWIIVASLLRGKFSSVLSEFDRARSRAKEACRANGIIIVDEKPEKPILSRCLTVIPSVNRKIGLIGREGIVDEIERALKKNRSRVFLYGIGGIGKTAVMQWICNGIIEKGYYAAWIQCSSSFKKDLLTFRNALDIPKSLNDEEACNRIIKELGIRFGDRLYLFLDGFPGNSSSDDIDIINSLDAHIMITSRVANDYFYCEKLENLKLDSAVQMFCEYYDRECENKETVSKIIHAVNGHTLLIELLAKAAMKEGGSLDDFYESVREKGAFGFFKRKIKTAQGNETIEKSIMKLYPLSDLTPEQQRIMKLFTIFTPEREIFYKVAQWADLDMDALDELVDRALLGRVGAEGNYRIHQIIRDSIARQMKNNNENLMIETYGDLLDFAISTDRYMHRNLVYKKVRERITLAEDIKKYLEERIQKDLDLDEHSKEKEKFLVDKMATLYNNLSGVYSMQGDYLLALDYITKALEIRKSLNGNEHELVATAYNNMSGVYRELGKYDQAMEYSMEALRITLKVSGNESLTTASIYNNLGGLYHALLKNDEALCNYEKALKIRVTLLGKEDPDTISVNTNIASLYLNQEEFESALGKLKDLEEVLKKEDLAKAAIYACIASAYLGLKNYEKAIEYNEKTLKIREEILSDENPETARSYNSLADVYKSKGEYNKALKYYRKALKIRKKKLGNEHPDTVSTANCIKCINDMIQKRKNSEKEKQNEPSR